MVSEMETWEKSRHLWQAAEEITGPQVTHETPAPHVPQATYISSLLVIPGSISALFLNTYF